MAVAFAEDALADGLADSLVEALADTLADVLTAAVTGGFVRDGTMFNALASFGEIGVCGIEVEESSSMVSPPNAVAIAIALSGLHSFGNDSCGAARLCLKRNSALSAVPR